MKVFMEVDSDRDGKITGDQARSLFLSWRLPREILKQVWDLSDQDNDSMLSVREFCVALYLEKARIFHQHFLVMSCLMKLCCLSRAHPILLIDLLVGELILVLHPSRHPPNKCCMLI